MSSQRRQHHDGSDRSPRAADGDAGGAGTAAPPGPGDPHPRTAVPKMGVRARIAEWPPKRDPKEAAGHREAAAACRRAPGFQALPPSSRRRSKEAEFQEGWPRPCPSKAWSPLRHRSSSEVTLSECEPDEQADKPGSPVGLYREYGSTSSIDVQGISEQSFFQMLTELRGKRSERSAGVTPEWSSGVTPEWSSGVTPEWSAGVTPEWSAGVTPEWSSGLTPDRSAGVTPDRNMGVTPEWNTGLTPDRSAAATPERSPAVAAPEGTPAASAAVQRDPDRMERTPPREDTGRDKPRRKGPRWEGGSESIFRKLRSGTPAERSREEPGRGWVCQRSFAHYDVQSMLFDLHGAACTPAPAARRRNTTTGASAASAAPDPSSLLPPEDLNRKENLEHDGGDATSNELLLSCPHFRNEIGGGGGERHLSFAGAAAAATTSAGAAEPPDPPRLSNAGVNVLEGAGEHERLRQLSVEHLDLGARYYREHFHGKEHSNYFGLDERLGPVAVSIRRERLEDHKDHGPQYQYRIIFRTSELVTLRGAILEDATPTATKAGTARGLPLRDPLEYVVPELNTHCLRLALSTPKVTEQLLKLDEQGLSRRHKVGILYCKAGQSSEEEMYNNELAGPPFLEFLALLGEKVPLKNFPNYAAQLDTKTDSTGTHSLYTTFQDYEIMFHVSTMLPYTPNNRQQLLRKRHIGNDIVTIIFQEPGALPFTPQNIRSHFQHVFIIVRAHQPCTDNVAYSVAVTRSKDVPPFGPPVPAGVPFRRGAAFRRFLLAKALNGENAAHKAPKFLAMATRTRQEYLRDLAQNYVTNTPLDSGAKFHLISLASKKKEKCKARPGAEQLSAGAVVWRVWVRDFSRGSEVSCSLGISRELVVLLDLQAKEVVFHCFCHDVLGWSADGCHLRLFYGGGDHVALRAPAQDQVKEIIQRLKVTTGGCGALELTLRRNGLGQLGFHVGADGTVAEVEEYGFAWQAGLRRGSRLLEVCKVAALTLAHHQLLDLLRTSVTVTVLLLPPHDDGTPRRGRCEAARPPRGDGDADATPAAYGRGGDAAPAAFARNSDGNPAAFGRSGDATPAAYGRNGDGTPAAYGRSGDAAPAAYGRNGDATPAAYGRSGDGNPAAFSRSGDAAPAAFTRSGDGAPAAFGRNGDGAPAAFSRSGDAAPAAFGRNGDATPAAFGRSGAGWKRGAKAAAAAAAAGAGTGVAAAAAPVAHREAQAPHGKRPVSFPETPHPSSSSSSSSPGPAQPFRQPSGSFSAPNGAYGRHRFSSTPRPPDPPEAEAPPGGLMSRENGAQSPDQTPPPPGHTRGPDAKFLPEPPRHPPGAPRTGPPAKRGPRATMAPPGDSPARRAQAESPSCCSHPGGDERCPEPPDPSPEEPLPDGDPPRPPKVVPPAPHDGDQEPPPAAATQPWHRALPPEPLRATRSQLGHDPSPRPPNLSSSVPKSFCSKQPPRTKQPPPSWKRPQEPPDPKKQVEGGAKNVFGQPRLRASLRDLRSPRRSHKSSIEDDLKRLIIMDPQNPPTTGLPRTLSAESLCGSRREAGAASAAAAAAAAGDPEGALGAKPSNTLPHRRQQPQDRGTLGSPEPPLKAPPPPPRCLQPGLMPLPDTAGLEWATLVSAAKAYEVQRAVSLFSLTEPPERPPAPPPASPLDLPGKVSQLEAMLKQLHSDLQKEKQDKVVLQAEVANLRQNNRRLQAESHSAARQLRRFARIFSGAGDKDDL